MKSIVRKNDEAVSPVIATILMVAITVVLAAVLYVMVSGLITSPGNTPKAIGVSVTKSSDGTNWIMTFTSVPSGLSNTSVSLTLLTTSGATKLSSTALSDATVLQAAKVIYNPATTGSSTVSAADRILLLVTSYGAGTQYSLTSSGSILASGSLS